MNAQRGAPVAVGGAAGPALGADAAGHVDFTAHALAAPRALAFYHSHKLMAQYSGEGIVAPQQLQIRVTDAGLKHAHPGLARRRPRFGHIRAKAHMLIFNPDALHSRPPAPWPDTIARLLLLVRRA